MINHHNSAKQLGISIAHVIRKWWFSKLYLAFLSKVFTFHLLQIPPPAGTFVYPLADGRVSLPPLQSVILLYLLPEPRCHTWSDFLSLSIHFVSPNCVGLCNLLIHFQENTRKHSLFKIQSHLNNKQLVSSRQSLFLN